jgi:hypothetical protein
VGFFWPGSLQSLLAKARRGQRALFCASEGRGSRAPPWGQGRFWGALALCMVSLIRLKGLYRKSISKRKEEYLQKMIQKRYLGKFIVLF